MTRDEFLEKWNADVLKSVRVTVGKRNELPYSMNCYEKNGVWVIGSVGERQNETVIYEGDESFIFDKLNKIVCGKLE